MRAETTFCAQTMSLYVFAAVALNVAIAGRERVAVATGGRETGTAPVNILTSRLSDRRELALILMASRNNRCEEGWAGRHQVLIASSDPSFRTRNSRCRESKVLR